MSKQVLVSIMVAIAGVIVLSIGAYLAIQFFSPPMASVPEQDPSAGILPRPGS